MMNRMILRRQQPLVRRYFASTASAVATTTTTARPRNLNLKQVITQGMPYLEASAKDVFQNTREPLLNKHVGPSPGQLSEASRLFEVVTDVVDTIADKTGEFCIQGSPIVVLDVEVSPDCKQARIFWCLPLHLCDLDEDNAEKVTQRMQQVLDKRGGSKIQSHVFGRLRFYYPPKLRFVPVPVQTAMESFLQS
jgi:ribosome-binding factor A